MTASALKSIEIALRANVTNFRAGIGLAAGDVRKFGQDLKKVGDTSDKDLKRVGQGAMIAGGAMVAGFALAQKAVIGFDQQISELGAVTGEAGAGLDSLRQAALKAGADTSFSASQAAQAQVELAKAGVSTADILNGALGGALNLAAAGHLELGRAAEISASAMTMFKLSGKDVPHIADLLAAGANKSAAEVEDMGAALQQSGLVAAQTGLSIEDTSAILAMFAQNGLKGSDAGTSLKTMLIALNPKSAEAAATMEGLGLKFYDAQGKFVGVTNMAEQLKSKLGGLTQEQRNSALMTIYGTDAIRAASIIYQEGGTGVDEWRTKVDDAGYASDLAAKKLDNLGGDIEKLKGSIETTFIQAGSGATGVLRGMTSGLTDLVNGLGSMPVGMQQATVGFVGLAGGVTFLGGAIATGVPKYQGMIDSLNGMGPAGANMAKGVGMGVTALAVAAPGLIYATQLWGELEAHASKAYAAFTKGWKPPESFAEQGQQMRDLIAEYERVNKIAAEGDGVGGFFKEMGQNLPGFSHEISNAEAESRKYAEAIAALEKPHKNWEDANRRLQQALGLSQDEVDSLARKAGIDLSGDVDKSTKALVAFNAGLTAGTPASQTLGTGLDGLKDKTKSAAEKFDDLKNSLKNFIDVAFGMGSAQDQLQTKLNALPEIIKATWGNLNGTADASIRFRDQMRGITTDATGVIESWVNMGIQGPELKTKIELLSLSLYNQALALGVPKEEALKYLEPLTKIANTPDITTAISAPGAVPAAGQVSDLNHNLGLINKNYTATVYVDVSKAEAALQRFLSSPAYSQIKIGMPFQGPGGTYVESGTGLVKIKNADGSPVTPAGHADGSPLVEGWNTTGEQGTELLHKQGSTVKVMSAPQTRRVLTAGPSGSGGPTTVDNRKYDNRRFDISLPNYLGDRRDAAREIAKEIRTIENSWNGN